MKPLPYREVKRKLDAAGFEIVGKKGSHVKFAKVSDSGTLTAIVPQHDEVVPGRFEVFCVRRDSRPMSLMSCRPVLSPLK
jgi:predicted RNA binding protein YcfA (HicA-like mRNA interferase family)